jgi:hypothetical protein
MGIRLFAILLGFAVTQFGDESFLDLLTIPPPTEGPAKNTRRICGGASRSEGQTSPVTVMLTSLDRADFALGDDIIFEVLIENVGNRRIPIAMSRNPELARSCEMNPDAVQTSFALVSRTKGIPGVVAVGPRLYGSHTVTGTTMMLEPKERLRVRVPATVDLDTPDRMLPDYRQQLDVAVMFSVQAGSDLSWPLELSQNTLAIEVFRREPLEGLADVLQRSVLMPHSVNRLAY